ncbi:MAG: 50S ribosomal protein L19 [Bdellovibrionaceae bacterium]|nr:50S ribosomal protein L19 [Pseudobdellovibrionaceae bacterium]
MAKSASKSVSKGKTTKTKAKAKTEVTKSATAEGPKVKTAKVKPAKVVKVKTIKVKPVREPKVKTPSVLASKVRAPKAKGTKGKFSKPKGGSAETNLIRRVTMKSIPSTIQDFRAGDTVNVYVKVREGEKERIQLFKGTVTKIQGAGVMKAFTVRKVSSGVGVERTFPFVSPALDKVELVATGKVRRAKLYYLRDLDGKAAKIESELAAPKATEAKTSETQASGSETPA